MEQYNVKGMSCAACSSRVEKAVSKVKGVNTCSVNLLTNSMIVEGNAASADIIKAVIDAGYNASLDNNEKVKSRQDIESINNSEAQHLTKIFLVSLVFLLLLMYISMGHNMLGLSIPQFLNDSPAAVGLAQMILAAVVMIINQRFFINGLKGIIHKSPNMDTLVMLGSGASFVYSTVMLFAMIIEQNNGVNTNIMIYMHDLFYESAAMILVLITVGKILEARSKGKTTDALKSLISMTPKTATVIYEGKEVVINTSKVKTNDIFIVRPGETIPVDGEIIEGSCAVNESALTGEAVPVDKMAGDAVNSASINLSGFIKCKATRVGEDSTLSQIIKLVSDASATKAPIARIADKVSGIFVPLVIIIAILTFVIWLMVGQSIGFALARGISVLVISCPCALGLATPVAIMVGNGKAARNGILFKTAAALENTGKTKIIAVDKTGTITKGQLEVTDIIPGACNVDELLGMAFSLEAKSEHPIAKAVFNEGVKRGYDLLSSVNFTIYPGNGLMAEIDGRRVQGGNYNFISSYTHIDINLYKKAECCASQGKTPVYFAIDNELAGIICVSDVIKEDSKSAIKQFKNMGINVVMLTGDNKNTARAIGENVGVDNIISEVLPDQKEKYIRDLMTQGKTLMVGDGINDAPALARADIGVAIGAGTDVAIDAADVILIKSTLIDAAAAIRLSRRVIRNIKENLFWAFIYNIIGIPLAAGVFISLFGWQLNPMFGAAAMSLSSFCVVMNALRLNFINIFDKSEVCINMKKTIKIEGMMCTHCEARVKDAIMDIEGVNEAIVNHETGTAVVKSVASISEDTLKEIIEKQGYKVIDII